MQATLVLLVQMEVFLSIYKAEVMPYFFLQQEMEAVFQELLFRRFALHRLQQNVYSPKKGFVEPGNKDGGSGREHLLQ